jgi:putative ABC transport system substrate-binding protein
MTIDIGRRQFVAALGGAAVAWPLAVRAQQPAMPVIGYLYSGAPESSAQRVAAFRKGLNETGYIEGENVAIEFRWANNRTDQLSELAADLVRRGVAVIATPASTPAALAAKAATTTIPIVFAIGSDPVREGLVANLARPGGNVTGVAWLTEELGAKRLGLLHELLPKAMRVALLVNPNNPLSAPFVKDVQIAAPSIGVLIDVFTATNNREIDSAFAGLAQKRADALLLAGDSLFNDRRVQIAMLAVRYAMIAMYTERDFTEAGGLISYGADLAGMIRQAGVYTGRVLKGEKPTNLPVMQASKLELVINLQTAKIIGLEIPPTLLVRADEVIE